MDANLQKASEDQNSVDLEREMMSDEEKELEAIAGERLEEMYAKEKSLDDELNEKAIEKMSHDDDKDVPSARDDLEGIKLKLAGLSEQLQSKVDSPLMKEMIAAYFNAFIQYTNGSDRTSRKAYWLCFLANVIIGVVAGLLMVIPLLGFLISIVLGIYALLAFIPNIMITVRRLNDIGKSWLYYLVCFIPIVGPFILIYFLIQDSIPDDGRPQV